MSFPNNTHAQVVLYHKNCFDGMCAAWVYRKWLNGIYSTVGDPDVKFYGITHNVQQIPTACVGKRVLLLDFCYKQQRLNTLLRVAEFVIILDHHKSSQSITVPVDKGFIVLDMERSGCQLAYDFIYNQLFSKNTIKRLPLVDYIGTRDLWKWDLPDCKEITTYIYSKPITFEAMTDLAENWNVTEYSKRGSILLDSRKKDTEEISTASFKATFTTPHTPLEHLDPSVQYNVKVVDCNWMFRSDVGNFLMEDDSIDFVVLYSYYASTKKFSVSLRGKDKVDLAKVAEYFGGGGHPNASAFQTTDLSFIAALPYTPREQKDNILDM
jgi:oligoribonuclease NrnB/cAMP/cGMP phosphodiesterase (DHH superfamily)